VLIGQEPQAPRSRGPTLLLQRRALTAVHLTLFSLTLQARIRRRVLLQEPLPNLHFPDDVRFIVLFSDSPRKK